MTALEKNKVRAKTRCLIRKGIIKRIPCEKCGNPKSQIHHPNYSRPDIVEHLCHSCHLSRHGKIDFRAFMKFFPKSKRASDRIISLLQGMRISRLALCRIMGISYGCLGNKITGMSYFTNEELKFLGEKLKKMTSLFEQYKRVCPINVSDCTYSSIVWRRGFVSYVEQQLACK